MEDDQPHRELVKCVLVGDNAVGKTRLICARACRQKVSLAQLLNTHVPTVWAIDQYRIYKDVLENSMMELDGVNVSLRLWDTFGDHHKDRRFAYGRSDVVLMCFDVGRAASLENCREMWLPQIKRFCPNTPVLLVGCKNDVRYILNDDQYLNYCRERSPLVRQVREQDLVMPSTGRAVARELGLPYFETSVLTYFGVNEVFENAIRAALCVRRQQRFWMTNLRRVVGPSLQAPFCPPRPKLPEVSVIAGDLSGDLRKLYDQQHFTDVILVCGSVGFSAHRFVLCASSPLFLRILTSDHNSEQAPTRANSETSLVSCSVGSLSFCGGDFLLGCEDTDCLIPPSVVLQHSSASASESGTPSKSAAGQQRYHGRRRRSNSFHLSPTMMGHWNENKTQNKDEGADLKPAAPPVFKALNHPALSSLRVQQCESLDSAGRVVTSMQTVLTCTKLVPPRAMGQLIQFVYTGAVDVALCDLHELKQAAEFLNVPELFSHVSALMNHRERSKAQEKDSEYSGGIEAFRRSLECLFLGQGLFADVLFRLDDGALPAHKPLLMSRCDMMRAMFTHEDFVESSARVVKFPGVTCFTFQQLLFYLYTDRAPRVSARTCVGVLELANRLCLPRLISLVEETVVSKMTAVAEEEGGKAEVAEDALRILQSCQVHNADQLADWCLGFLSQSYNHICRKHPKILRNLHPENQAWLNVHRWPPVWYLKDHDFYQRLMADREREERPKNLKRSRHNSGGSTSGCLCFSTSSSKSKRKGSNAS